MRTFADCLDWLRSYFDDSDIYFGHGTDNSHDEALHLLLHVIDDTMHDDQNLLQYPVSDAEIDELKGLAKHRVNQRKPLPYILGYAWYASLKFIVDERVLIPRSPIAELIAQEFRPWLTSPPLRVLDMCTGSGCIGIVSAMQFDQVQVDLVDLSAAALEVAKANVSRFALEKRVQTIQSDLFAALDENRKYSVILANPPYVGSDEMQTIPEEYRQEPAMALLAEDDGLQLACKILAQAERYLTADGLLVLEVGNSDLALQAKFPDIPFLWAEFEHGGHGVLLISAAELAEYRDYLSV